MSDPVHALLFKMMDNLVEPRWSRQEKLEEELAKFNPDYNEIEELLAAMFSGFKSRYSDGEWDRVQIALEDFKSRLYNISQMQQEYEPSGDDPE